jgi:hypothetical protein
MEPLPRRTQFDTECEFEARSSFASSTWRISVYQQVLAANYLHNRLIIAYRRKSTWGGFREEMTMLSLLVEKHLDIELGHEVNLL